MVTERDREHFRRIAEGMERLNRESIEREARLSPGARIEAALALTRQVLASNPRVEEKHPVSLPRLWRARHR